MSEFTRYFADAEGLLGTIGRNAGNRYILDCSRGRQTTPENPLPFLRYWSKGNSSSDKNLSYHLTVRSDGLIVAGTSFMSLPGPFFYDKAEPPKSAKLAIDGICTRPDHCQNRFVRDSLIELFKQAQSRNAMLSIELQPDAPRELVQIMPAVHADFPAVPVAYDDIRYQAVTADRPYGIVKGRHGALEIAYS